MKLSSFLNSKILSRNEMSSLSGGKNVFLDPGDGGGLDCYQCCNAWGCGWCACGVSNDCSSYGDDVYSKAC